MTASLRFTLLGGCLVVAALFVPDCARIARDTHLDPAPAARVLTTAAATDVDVAPADEPSEH